MTNMNERLEVNKSWIEKITQWLTIEPRSREDLIDLLKAAQERGILDSDALSIIEGAMSVADRQVREIMIPRAQTVMLKATMPIEEILPLIVESAHSRFPIVGDNPDEVIGILLAKDLLSLVFNKSNDRFNLKEVLRPPIFIPESKRLNVLLREFRTTKHHMAIVVDEYGCMAGIVTIEDILEQIVGEIEDEHDSDEDDLNIKKLGKNDYVVKAITSIEDFNLYFNTNFSDEEFDTIGGVVTCKFGHLPERDETIVIGGLQFKILNADSRRVHLLQVTFNKKIKVSESPTVRL